MENNDIKDLKRLSRKELFEIILAQLSRINELEDNIELLENKLKDKTININDSGSIAEAALKLSGIFETAQAACNEYLDNVNKNCELAEKARIKENNKLKREMVKETKLKCQKMLEKAQAEAEKIKEEATKVSPRNKKRKPKIDSKNKKVNNEKKKE